MNDLLSALIGICGPDRVSDKLADRICYTRDCGPSPGDIPDLIVRPVSASEISAIIQVANKHRTPVFIWGRSTT
ncbi:MAG: glycolate oxidase subunit GlcD, partial [Anaerolineae bacterium]